MAAAYRTAIAHSVLTHELQALPLLGAVALLLLMVLFLYAVAAVQMFTDVYHNVCMGPDPTSGEVKHGRATSMVYSHG
jgi:hypothetical protein